MSTEFNFTVVDANRRVEAQQGVVRQLVSQRIDLTRFKRLNPLPLPPPMRQGKSAPEPLDEPVE
jgi:hypothetical protein